MFFNSRHKTCSYQTLERPSNGPLPARQPYGRNINLSTLAQQNYEKWFKMPSLWFHRGEPGSSTNIRTISHATGKRSANTSERCPQSPRLGGLLSAENPVQRHTTSLDSTTSHEIAKSSNHTKRPAQPGKASTYTASAPDESPSISRRESLRIRTSHVSSVAPVDDSQLSIGIGDGELPDQPPPNPGMPKELADGEDEATATTQPAEHQWNVGSLASLWQREIAYDERVMRSLGKNRFLAYQLEVPSDARARFEKFKGAFDADVKRLVAGISSHGQILLSYRLCMVGVRKGGNIAAEPTLVLSCGSQKWKTIIKRTFCRIQPHYFRYLGMSLLVHYEKSPAVLAAKLEVSSGDEIAVPRSNWYQGFKAIHIQHKPSTVCCGLGVRINSRIQNPTIKLANDKAAQRWGALL
ncbi:MAG: hypothetical protein Q9160_001649 [Pyrenula sp. 1 TL-2023]